MIDLTDASVAGYGEIAESYSASAGPLLAAPVARRLIELADLQPGQRVLDLGCGAGEVTIRAAMAVGPVGHVRGTDVSAAMLDLAAKEATAAGLTTGPDGNADFVTGDAATIAADHSGDGQYDVVAASMLLHLLPDPGLAVTRWRGLLRRGGVLVASWPAGGGDRRWKAAYRAADRHITGDMPGFVALTKRIPGHQEMFKVLRPPHYCYAQVMTEPVTVRFENADQWWRDAWVSDVAVSWRHIPLAARNAARKDAFRWIARIPHAPDGALERTVPVNYLIAQGEPAIPG